MDGYFQKVARNAQVRADLRASIRVPPVQTSYAPYCYTPLVHQGEIRLIKFVDFSSEKPIIELSHVHVDQDLHYRALSYTWGNEAYTSSFENPETKNWEKQNPKDIILIRRINTVSQELEVGSLEVTKNCAEALWRLNADGPHVAVWIDAICIDQANIQERNHQIGLMELIYRGAVKVQVYIGADDMENHSDEAMKYFERNFRSILQGQGNPFEKFGYVEILHRRIVDAIAHLLKREWFQRVWVLQEVQSAKYAEIICGRYKIPWLAIRLVAPSFYNLTPTARLPPILDIAEGGLRSKDLLSLLRETRSLQATDSRDKVYAMLTLAYNVSHSTPDPEEEDADIAHQMYAIQLFDWFRFLIEQNLISSDDILSPSDVVNNVGKVLKLEEKRKKHVKIESQRAIRYDIVPDYSASLFLVFAEMARTTINSSENLNVFDEIVYSGISDLPSWVPDWSIESSRARLSEEMGEDFNTSGDLKFEFTNMTTPLELVVRGKLLGKVDYSNYSNVPSPPFRRVKNDDYVVRSVLFEVSHSADTSCEEPEDMIATIMELIAIIFSRAESLAVQGMMLKISMREDVKSPKFVQRQLDTLREYDTLRGFINVDGSEIYRSINVVPWPEPGTFSNFLEARETFRKSYFRTLVRLKTEINEQISLYEPLLQQLEVDAAGFSQQRGSMQLQTFEMQGDRIWLQKRDLPTQGLSQENSIYAIVDDKLFAPVEVESYGPGDFSPLRPSMFSFNDSPGHKSVLDLEPELESQLRFLKEVLYKTILCMNGRRRYPDKLRHLQQKLSKNYDFKTESADQKLSKDRSLFVAGEYQGIGPKAMQCGDIVCILCGARVPYVLRPVSEELGKYRLIGECYVEGIMNGEAMEPTNNAEMVFNWFTLV